MLVIFSELISHYITYCQGGNNYFILCSITLHAPLLKAGGVFGTFPQGLFFRWKKQPFKIGGVFVTFLAGAFFFAEKTPYSTPTQDPLLNSLTQVIRGRSFNKIL